mmetsp:Transcript_19485/g.42380  ORF Transcript_19485/g.42380 Transcript_19485/m.42380 type:complete len:1342 (-) Transcript_19485:1717-5742(-)
MTNASGEGHSEQPLSAAAVTAAPFVPVGSPPQSPRPTGSSGSGRGSSMGNGSGGNGGGSGDSSGRHNVIGPSGTTGTSRAPSSNGTSAAAATKTLDSTAVLANRFIPSSLKALNQADVSATLTAGKIPSLYGETKNLYETLIPHGVECRCTGEKHRQSNQNHEAAMVIRKVPIELRYGLYSNKPLTTDGSNSMLSPSPTTPQVAASEDSEEGGEKTSTESEVMESNETKAEKKRKKKMEARFAALTGRAERDRYETIVGLDSIRDAMTRETKDMKKASDFRNKFEGLLILERDEILRLYEYLSQYKVEVIPFAQHDGPANFLYAHVRIPGIADVQPSLSVGDTCLVRPVEPLQMPAYQDNSQMIYDHSRKAYVPNPVEIQASVLRIVRGRDGMPDEVVVTWLSVEDDAALQHAWSYYAPDRRRYNVRFVPHALFQERCLTALDWVARLPRDAAEGLILAKEEAEQLNLPKYRDGHQHSEAVDGKCVDIGQYSLNGKQHDFVSMCVSRTIHASTEGVREPMLLTGPAGTGKTRTLYAAINQVLDLDPKNRILVCAPSHTAANVLTERLGEDLSEKELFRLVDTNRGSETIPFAVLKFTRRNEMSGVFTLPSPDELMKFRVIICTCLDAHLLYRAGLTNATLRKWRSCLSSSIETIVSEAKLQFEGKIMGVNEPHFTHLFIDEAAQATEPESLIPLSVVVDPVPGSVKVEIALVGDPRQLGPQVYSSTAADNGLGYSYIERLLQRPNTQAIADSDDKTGGAPIDDMAALLAFYNEDKEQTSVFLNMNYRCQPAFLMMPSALFYFDKLQSAKSSATADPEETSRWCSKLRQLEKVKERVGLDDEMAGDVSADIPKIFRPTKQHHWPIHFRGVVGRDVSVALDNFSGTNSWSNVEEAKEVCSIVLNLARAGVKPEDIGVMAPFRGQVVKIRSLLRESGLGVVNVGTIEDYQAVERDVIVLSLTRSTHKFVEFDVKRRAGVFRQPKTTNVALTRAEHLLVVVGNPNVMAQCPIWRQWLWFCLRNGLWYGDPGTNGHAGLELTDEVVYSTTRPMGDVIDSDIITVGTLERISRKSEVSEPDSLDDLIARGVYSTGKDKVHVTPSNLPPSVSVPPEVPPEMLEGVHGVGAPSFRGVHGVSASGMDMMGNHPAPEAATAPSNFSQQQQLPHQQPNSETRTDLGGPGAAMVGSQAGPTQAARTHTPLFGPSGMGARSASGLGPPPQQVNRAPVFGRGGFGRGGPPPGSFYGGRGPYGPPPPQYFHGGMMPPPGHHPGFPGRGYPGRGTGPGRGIPTGHLGPSPGAMGGPPPLMGGPPPPGGYDVCPPQNGQGQMNQANLGMSGNNRPPGF